MSDFKYEIGDEFKNRWGHYRKVLWRCVGPDGLRYYTVEEKEHVEIYDETYLDEWTKVEPFFQVGDWWEDGSEIRYTVTHVDPELMSAWVIWEFPGGKERVTHGAPLWRHRKSQILKNRKG